MISNSFSVSHDSQECINSFVFLSILHILHVSDMTLSFSLSIISSADLLISNKIFSSVISILPRFF